MTRLQNVFILDIIIYSYVNNNMLSDGIYDMDI